MRCHLQVYVPAFPKQCRHGTIQTSCGQMTVIVCAVCTPNPETVRCPFCIYYHLLPFQSAWTEPNCDMYYVLHFILLREICMTMFIHSLTKALPFHSENYYKKYL